MIDILKDPDFYTIDEAMEMGVWPRGGMFADGVYPYIARLKQDHVTMTVANDFKGENIFSLFEIDTKNKIEILTIENTDVLGVQYKPVFTSNLKKSLRPVDIYDVETTVDVAFVECSFYSDSNQVDKLTESFEESYKNLRPSGIFGGNDHPSQKVKEALVAFRRKNKIGEHIRVSKGSWFWYKR